MKKDSKRLVSRRRGKKEAPINLFYGTWVADFMLRQQAGKFTQGKCLSDKQIPWRQRRRLGMAVAGLRITPPASQVATIGKMQSAGCRLCRKVREALGKSIDNLAAETYGDINSAGCEGMANTITATRHFIWRHLYDSMHATQKPKSKSKEILEETLRHKK